MTTICIWRISLSRSLSLVEEEEELLEGAEEGPLREHADALVAEDLDTVQ